MTDEERREKATERQRAWRAANQERAREQARENAKRWRKTNPERSRELNRKSDKRARERDPEGQREKGRKRMAAWRADNSEKAKEADRRWREENPEASRKKSRRWREAHPEVVVENNAAYSKQKKERRVRDPEWAQGQRDRSVQWAKDNPEKIVENYRRYRNKSENVLRDQLTNARNRATKKGLPFDDALFLVVPPSSCEACGTAFGSDIVIGSGKRINLRALSFDRVDNTKGYTLENVGYLCYGCNAIKKNATVVELKAIVAYIERHLAAQHQ